MTDSAPVVQQSRIKIQKALEKISPWIGTDVVVESRPCSVYEATLYRNRCTLQVVKTEGSSLEYAVRVGGKPVVVETYEIATARIQLVMNHLLRDLRDHSLLAMGLRCVTFAAAWGDAGADCLVTMHYDQHIEDVGTWQHLARMAAVKAGIQQVTGRSRCRKITAFDDVQPVIRDQVYLNFDESAECWKVFTSTESFWKSTLHQQTSCIEVCYVKPEDAFSHPNATIMCRSLSWILNELHWICSKSPHPLKLMELFCGFGAHTLAILQANIPNLDACFAVDYDRRLIEALTMNCELNSLASTSELKIVHADAFKWLRRRNKEVETLDIALVDPPRQGLGGDLVSLINGSTVWHLLYVSCGIEALAGDLSKLEECFIVRKCLVLDLFPKTGAVESLLHLERHCG